ncbi:MAG: hypothetical protein WCW87_03175 [Candidatus Paceibacterota bacterium]
MKVSAIQYTENTERHRMNIQKEQTQTIEEWIEERLRTSEGNLERGSVNTILIVMENRRPCYGDLDKAREYETLVETAIYALGGQNPDEKDKEDLYRRVVEDELDFRRRFSSPATSLSSELRSIRRIAARCVKKVSILYPPSYR